MRATFVIALTAGLTASIVSAQTLDDIGVPQCARGCIFVTLPLSKCRDYSCICRSNDFRSTFNNCLAFSCLNPDYETALNDVHSICNSLGAPFDFPSPPIDVIGPTAYDEIKDIPQCARGCILGSTPISQCSSPTDFECTCAANIFLTECGQNACAESDWPDAASSYKALCGNFNVAVTVSISAPTETFTVPAVTTTLSFTVSSDFFTTAPEPSTTGAGETPSTTESSGPSAAPSTTRASSNGTVSGGGSSPTGGNNGSGAGRNAAAFGTLGAILAFVAALI